MPVKIAVQARDAAACTSRTVSRYETSAAPAFTGDGRPSRGVMYLRNSTPMPVGPPGVMRRWAPKTLLRCSWSQP